MQICPLRRGVLSAALGSCLALAPTLAAAATFTVNSNGDAADANPGNAVCATSGSVCTLRAAIQEANALAGADTVNIPSMTIVVGSPLAVFQDVNVNGAGPSATVIDGNNATQVFNFATGTSSISNLTIRNGWNPTGNGGGIFNEGVLTLTNVTVSGCMADQGGGVYNQYAFVSNVPLLNLSYVTLFGNTAGIVGGGLFNGSALNAQVLTISGNTAMQAGGYFNNSFHVASLSDFLIVNNVAGYAGGINNDLGTINLTRGKISGNVSNCCGPSNEATGGAGIYNNEGTMTLTDVAITDNRATSAGGYGGGLYSYQTMTLRRVTVARNTATYGAGIFNGNFYNVPNSLTLENVTITGNIGLTSGGILSVGGGLYNTNNGQTLATNLTMTGNTAWLAGGINNQPTSTSVTLRNSILSGNTATTGSPDCSGTISSGGYNLVGSTSGCSFGVAGSDQVGVDPRLDQRIGFPGHHPIRPGSPAFQTGSNAFCPTPDTRGLSRPQGGVCDRGAFELGDYPVVGNWDGEGVNRTTTIGIYRPWEQVWYLRNTIGSGVNDVPAILYGGPDVPVVGDWNGDGIDTVGVYRPAEHVWYLRNSNTSGFNNIPAILLGADGDIPVVGDWNGDGADTIGVYRPSEHVWYLRNSNTSGINDIPAILLGADGDIPVVGDWNGDGVDTIGVYRPSEGVWYLRNSNTSGINDVPAILYGGNNDLPVVGDWDGNGTTTIGVYRLTERVWYLRNSNTSGMNDVPAALF